MDLEYDVKRWIEEEKDKIPSIMQNFFEAVNLDYHGKLVVQKLSPLGSVQIVPQEGLIMNLSIKLI